LQEADRQAAAAVKTFFLAVDSVVLWVTGCQRCVVGEGMPRYRNPFEKGNLYIKFDVIFPSSQFIDKSQLQVCILL